MVTAASPASMTRHSSVRRRGATPRPRMDRVRKGGNEDGQGPAVALLRKHDHAVPYEDLHNALKPTADRPDGDVRDVGVPPLQDLAGDSAPPPEPVRAADRVTALPLLGHTADDARMAGRGRRERRPLGVTPRRTSPLGRSEQPARLPSYLTSPESGARYALDIWPLTRSLAHSQNSTETIGTISGHPLAAAEVALCRLATPAPPLATSVWSGPPLR